MLPGYDALNPVMVRDPGPWLGVAREQVPAFYSRAHKEWVATRFDLVHRAMNDTDTFSRGGLEPLPSVPAEMAEEFPHGTWAWQYTSGRTGAAQRHLRRHFAPAFA